MHPAYIFCPHRQATFPKQDHAITEPSDALIFRKAWATFRAWRSFCLLKRLHAKCVPPFHCSEFMLSLFPCCSVHVRKWHVVCMLVPHLSPPWGPSALWNPQWCEGRKKDVFLIPACAQHKAGETVRLGYRAGLYHAELHYGQSILCGVQPGLELVCLIKLNHDNGCLLQYRRLRISYLIGCFMYHRSPRNC